MPGVGFENLWEEKGPMAKSQQHKAALKGTIERTMLFCFFATFIVIWYKVSFKMSDAAAA